MNRRDLLVLATGIPLSGCAAGTDTASWVEQVKLHDGEIIKISRRARRQHSGFPSYARGAIIDYDLTFQQVSWSGEWNRIPASFELFDGIPHLAVYIGDSVTCKKKSASDYAALFYKYKNGYWTEVPQSDFPTSAALINLFEDLWGHTADDDPRGEVSWITKAAKDGFDPNQPYTIDKFFEKYQNRLCRWVKN